MATATEVRTGVYEAMFLANQAAAASFGDLITHINTLLNRAHADVLAMKKWDERRLAFEIDKQKRGVYILAYFSCPTDMVARLERDVQISDQLLRVLVTSADHLSDEEIKGHDDRKGLDTEAKLRAEQGVSSESEGSGKVRFGAPEQPKQEEASAPDSENDDDSGDDDEN